MPVEKSPPAHDTLYVQEATASTLAALLHPEVPYVWIFGHTPRRALAWWTATVPLNTEDSIRGQVRQLSYDLQLPTAEFLRQSRAFDDHGLALVQARRPMPDTLDLRRIPDDQQDQVLVRNGAFLRLWLPHAVETAWVVCYEAGYLESVRSRLP